MRIGQLNGATVPGCLAREDAATQRNREWARQLPIFSNLTAGETEDILAAAREREFLRRETMFHEGARCRQVLLLVSGCVKSTQLGPTGGEVILRLNGPGELIGVVESYLGKDNGLTARATQRTLALVWNDNAFEHFSDRYPVLRRNTTRLLGLCLQELEERFREVATEKVALRLSQQLIRISRQLQQDTKGTLEISLSREELGQLSGTTLFTVSRLLCQWEKLGIVSNGRETVAVRNLQALTEIGECEAVAGSCDEMTASDRVVRAVTI